MAKIIDFPRNPRCVRENGTQAKINAVHAAGCLAGETAQVAFHNACIEPIWKSRKRGILVSVVLPARGRPDLLNRCLAALTRQSFSYRQYEIIVVDTVPSKASRKIMEAYIDQPRNRPCIIYLPVTGEDSAAAARNHGWHIARGAIIAFTEEDAIPAPDWLAQGMQIFDGVVQAACGRIVTHLPGLPTEHERVVKRLEQAEFASLNCFCLRPVLENLGGFDERFGTASRQDVDLHFRLLQADAAIAQAPLAVVEHPAGEVPWGASLRQQKDQQFDALLYKKHPGLYRKKIAPATPWNYHAIVMVLLFLLAAQILHKSSAASLGTVFWIMLSAHLCLQRLRGTAKTTANISEILFTSLLLPLLSVFWRMVGALRFRVVFI